MSKLLLGLVMMATVAVSISACAVVPVGYPGPAVYAPAGPVVVVPGPPVVYRPHPRRWYW